MRICGRSVDDVWVQMYKSNQPSKHYNRTLLDLFSVGRTGDGFSGE